MCFTRNWEFGSALLKLRNFGGFEPPNPSRYATAGSRLPQSHIPTNTPCPEPARSIPHPHIPFPSQYYSPIYTWVFQVVSFHQVSPPNFCERLSSPPCAVHVPPIIFLDFSTHILVGKEYRSLRSSLCNFLPSPPLSHRPLRPKYSPQHTILKYPRPTFLPQCDHLTFTPIQNNRQTYGTVQSKTSHQPYINVYFWLVSF
jgi:hypothetical protein